MALTEQMILEKLHEIHAPGSPMSLVESGAVRQLEVEGTSVTIVLAVNAPQPSTAGEVKAAVEQLFDVKVANVRTVNMKGKTKRQGQRRGKRSDWKKAYVSLQQGHEIDLASIGG